MRELNPPARIATSIFWFWRPLLTRINESGRSGNWSGAGANDQFSGQAFGFHGFVAHDFSQIVHGGSAEPEFWLPDGGQRNGEMLGHKNISKTTHGNISRYLNALFQ